MVSPYVCMLVVTQGIGVYVDFYVQWMQNPLYLT